VEFGPGIALYFNFLQWMACMFSILFVLNFPTILVAAAAKYYGPLSAGRNSTGYQAIWDGPGGFNLGSTTFGSIAPDDVEESQWLVYDDGTAVHTISRRHFLYGRAAQMLPATPCHPSHFEPWFFC